MDMKAQANKNAAASQQVASTPSGCKSCERKGVAIYPLRVAAVPASLVNTRWHPAVPHQDTELKGGEFKYALRTLREGYVYVLADKQVWYAYQVTPQGFLRMFNAKEMPEGGKVEPLSAACLQQNHDIRSSFINIDPKHTHAAVAFSNDPWPRDVLAKYKQAGAPAPRFTQLTIADGKAVTIEGAGRSLTLDPTLSTLTKNVLEFATEKFPSIVGKEGQPDGAYGFYPRRDLRKQTALGNKVAELQELYGAVHAIVLDDAVGVVQELNNGRLDAIQALSAHTGKVENIHQKMISDAILQIKASTASQMAHDPSIQGVYTPGYTTSYTASRETVVAQKVHSAVHRMEDYYNESARAEFARKYDAIVDNYNGKIAAIWLDLDTAWRSEIWKTQLRDDYAPESNALSWTFQLLAIARCLHGGMAGVRSEDVENGSVKPVWIDWMEDGQSPAFLALLRGTQGLGNEVFSGTVNYPNLKAGLNSQELTNFFDSLPYQRAVTSLLTAIAGAHSQLNTLLSDAAKGGMVRMMQAVSYVSVGVPAITVFSGELTVREFQEVLLTQLDAQGKTNWTVQAKENSSLTRTTGAGHWLQITDPALLEQKIEVRLTAPLKELHSAGGKKAARAAGTSVAAIAAGNVLTESSQLSGFTSLTPQIIDNSLTTGEIRLSPADMKAVARNQTMLSEHFQSGVIGAALAYIMLQTTLSNLKELKSAIPGDLQGEMSLASRSLLVLASATELVGQGATALFKAPAVGGQIAAGDLLIRTAGVIGGIAVFIDGVALLMKASDLSTSGDSAAAYICTLAGGALISAGVVGVGFSAAGEFGLLSTASFAGIPVLLGPVGWAIALGVTAFTLTAIGSRFIRSPLERWLTHTCFSNENDRNPDEPFWNAKSLEDMHKAMNALHVLTSGVSAQLSEDWFTELSGNTQLLGNRMVAARAVLADCDPEGSAWLLELTATGSSGKRLLLARSASAGKLAGLVAPEAQTFEKTSQLYQNDVLSAPEFSTVTSKTTFSESWSLMSAGHKHGVQFDGEFPLNITKYNNVELTVTYWPDKKHQEQSLEIFIYLDS